MVVIYVGRNVAVRKNWLTNLSDQISFFVKNPQLNFSHVSLYQWFSNGGQLAQ